MPPSPRLKATVDMEAYDRACRDLRIVQPLVEGRQGNNPEGARYGDYAAGLHRVRLYLGGIKGYELDGLRSAQTELVNTMLHELRHAWQVMYRPEVWANHEAAEHDAEGWAIRNVANYRNIVRLSRSFPNSGFSRLSRHAVRR